MIYVDPPENRFLWMDFPAPERTDRVPGPRQRPGDPSVVEVVVDPNLIQKMRVLNR